VNFRAACLVATAFGGFVSCLFTLNRRSARVKQDIGINVDSVGRSIGLVRIGGESFAYDPEGQGGRIALSGKQASQSAEASIGRQVPARPQFPFNEASSHFYLRLRVDLVEGVGDDLVIDALASQLVLQRLSGEPTRGLTRLDPGVGKGSVVNESYCLEPVEYRGGYLGWHSLGVESILELVPRPGLTGQLGEHDRARHRLWVCRSPQVVLARVGLDLGPTRT
jgi:hypothetical protein